MPRRSVLLGLVALPLAGCLGRTTVHARALHGAITLRPDELAGLVNAGDAIIVRAPEAPGPVILRRGEGGALTAMLALCTHRACELSAAPESYECPCHGSAFDLQGRVLQGPADQPLTSFGVKETAERVVILLVPGAP